MKRSSFYALALCMIMMLMVVAALPAARRLAPASAVPDPQQAVQHAWELVKQSGSYSFVAQVDQVNIPLSIPINFG
jgi:hypothetical protein